MKGSEIKSFEGKVALVTGAARGQGRSHVLGFASAGADVIAIDSCADVPSVDYPLSTRDDLRETARRARDHGVTVIDKIADVRSSVEVSEAIAESISELGGLDVISINAGIVGRYAPVESLNDEVWADVISVNLTGAFNSARAAIPFLRDRGGGAIIFTSSVAGLQGMAHLGAYVASKHGILGLMKTMAMELAPDNIRVNALLPTSVPTPMLLNESTYRLMRPDLDEPGFEDVVDVFRSTQLLTVPYVECEDVTSALLWLASDQARMVTGVALPIDGGALLKKG